jgi:hypothetical protein
VSVHASAGGDARERWGCCGACGGLRQESAAVNELATGQVTCGWAVLGAPVVMSAGGSAPDLPPGLPTGLSCGARARAGVRGPSPGNPGFGAGRAEADVVAEVANARGCGRMVCSLPESGPCQAQWREGVGCCPPSRRTTRSLAASQRRFPPPLTAAVSATHSRCEQARSANL